MQKLLLLTFVLATLGVRAQDNPWSKEPAKKEVLNADEWDRTSNIPVYLKIDTLHRNSQPDERDRVSRMWYGTDAIGYGYADKQGRPYGVWKYYTRSGNAYQLLCEGFYTALKPEGLIVDPEIQKQFASASDKKNKEDFLAALPDRFLFTGEWRFYSGGKLERIVVLSEQSTLPYETAVQMSDDGGSISSTALIWAVPQRRLAGQVLASVLLTPEGYLKSLHSTELSLKFDSKGKPVPEELINPYQ